MSLDEVEYLDQKSAIERAKYRTALSIKDYAALIYFDGDASDYLCQEMQTIANNKHIILWYSADFVEKNKNEAYLMLGSGTPDPIRKRVSMVLFWKEETLLLNYILLYRSETISSALLEKELSKDGRWYCLEADFLGRNYELLLMSDLPETGPEGRKMYLERNESTLRYVAITPKGKNVDGSVNITLKGTLTERSLALNRELILNEISKRNHPERKVYGEIIEGSINIPIDKNRLKFDSHGKMINEQYQDELRRLIIEKISSKTNIPVEPTENEIKRLWKWREANKFINAFIREALVNHGVIYEPKGRIIPALERSPSFNCQYDIEFVNSNGLHCRESGKTIKVEKNIVAQYVLSNYGRWMGDIIKDTLLAEELNIEDKRRSEIEALKAEAGIAVESKEARFLCNKEDFEHWCRQPYWTVEEGIFLLLGKKPKVEASGLFGPRRYAEPSKSQEFDQIKETAYRHIEAGELSRQPTPKEFVTWAINMGYTVPAQLLGIISPKAVWPSNELDSLSLAINQSALPKEKELDSELQLNTEIQGETFKLPQEPRGNENKRKGVNSDLVDAFKQYCLSCDDSIELVWNRMEAQKSNWGVLGISEMSTWVHYKTISMKLTNGNELKHKAFANALDIFKNERWPDRPKKR
jgi:hypothetical protein